MKHRFTINQLNKNGYAVCKVENFKIFKDLVTSFNLTFLNKCDDIEKSIISEYFQRCFDIEIDNGESGSAS